MKESLQRFGLPVLAIGVVISLLLNIVLLSQWFAFRNEVTVFTATIQTAIDGGIADLQEFRDSTIAFTVEVDETVPINTELPIVETFDFPVKTDFPIKQEFETTIEVQGPFGLAIPVTVDIPVDLVVPIDLTVPVEIRTTVPVDIDVPLVLDVPLEIPVAETELATLVRQLEATLRELGRSLEGLPQ